MLLKEPFISNLTDKNKDLFIEDMVKEGRAEMRSFAPMEEDHYQYGRPNVSFMVNKNGQLYIVLSINALCHSIIGSPTIEKILIAYDYDFRKRKPESVGSIFGFANEEKRYITTFNVKSSYRGTGIGGYLMHSINEEFSKYFPETNFLCLDCDKSQDAENEDKYANWRFEQNGPKYGSLQPMQRDERNPLVQQFKELWLAKYTDNLNKRITPETQAKLNEIATEIKEKLNVVYDEQQESARALQRLMKHLKK